MSIAGPRDEPTYQRISDQIEEFGDIMVRTTSGEELELHKHDVEFQDEPYVNIEADDDVHWVDTTNAERYWIHKGL